MPTTPSHNEILSLDELVYYIKLGVTDWSFFGDVQTKTSGDLVLFNSTQDARQRGRWNFFERISRGLIINQSTGEIVARPFDKFFNWGEEGRTTIAGITQVTEKYDGSLGILYRDQGYKIASKGSFRGEHAVWATRFLNSHYSLTSLPEELTLLFEIIFPENRVVIDYGNREDLILLAVRHRFTGNYLPIAKLKEFAHTYGFTLPSIGHFSTAAEIIQHLSTPDRTVEGWVAEFSDGSRFKFRSSEYRELHRKIFTITFHDVLIAIENGVVGDVLDVIPEKSLGKISQWISEIESRRSELEQQVEDIYNIAPKQSYNIYREWVFEQYPHYLAYLDARWHNHKLASLIYQTAFSGRDETTFFRPHPDVVSRIYNAALERGLSSSELIRTGQLRSFLRN